MKDYLQRQFEIFTEEENNKIEKMNVMVAGAGGLGTNQAQQLIRMGINKIYLYDHDKVELSNLNRQIFYGKDDIGKNKVDIAKKQLDKFDLDTEIVAIHETIDENIELPDDIDLVFDALDNFNTRFILEELSYSSKIPFIHGGIESWFGQVLVIKPEETIRLKDVFSGVENSGKTPPVMSPAVSIIASIQVLEGIKVYLQKESYLKNKLLIVDLESCEIQKVDLKNT
ncbi:MAG TPA: HesA/MoeB/ThiF family protein [Halanaerobiales bacterium]|nr:HesA/MoeB/ThiF family protein [Halanaerobiales bacterium]